MEMRKIVVSTDSGWCPEEPGEFKIPKEIRTLYKKLSGNRCPAASTIRRDDPFLVRAIEIQGNMIESDDFSFDHELRIVEIPEDVDWEICSDLNGYEWVAEKHRRWFAK